MTEKDRVRASKFLSLVLRHKPEEIGLTLESGGWVDVDVLLKALARAGRPLSRGDLAEIVATCEKRRYSFDEAGKRIRANQGHSVEVDLALIPALPPDMLYHGTAARFMGAISAGGGLRKLKRHHVHLSADQQTAYKVGVRHGAAVVLRIDAKGMHQRGYVFYCSENGVWLTDHVPIRFIRPIGDDTDW